MNKKYFWSALALSVAGFFTGIRRVSAAIPGKYLTADLAQADLLDVAKKHPDIFWTLLIVLIVVGLGYGIFRTTRKKEAS